MRSNISLIVATLLVGNNLMADENLTSKIAPINPDFIKWQQEQQKIKVRSSVSQSSSRATGYIPSPKIPEVHKSITKPDGVEILGSGNYLGVDFPDRFDLSDANLDGNRSDSNLTAVKNQGSCGACWAFAGYGALEGQIKIDLLDDLNLSENHLRFNAGFDWTIADPCAGGNLDIVSAYLMRGDGPVSEADDPYFIDNNGTLNTDTNQSATRIRYVDNVIELPVRSGATDIDYIKSVLFVNKKPLYTSMQIPEGTAGETGGGDYNDTIHSYYYKDLNTSSRESNHAVVIVGWDDNITIEHNISSTERGILTGAFIVRNSWGDDWGNDGYFYIPYADDTVGYQSLAYFDDKAEDSLPNIQKIYQHDKLGNVTKYGSSSQASKYGANIFVAEQDGILEAVTFYATATGTDYEITIYDDITTNNDTNISTFGNQLGQIKSGTGLSLGWHTIKLDTPIPLNAGNDFIVSMKFTNSSYQVPIESNLTDYTSWASADRNQSFYSSTGTSWNDLQDILETNANVNIKAIVANPPQKLYDFNITLINTDLSRFGINAIEINSSSENLAMMGVNTLVNGENNLSSPIFNAPDDNFTITFMLQNDSNQSLSDWFYNFTTATIQPDKNDTENSYRREFNVTDSNITIDFSQLEFYKLDLNITDNDRNVSELRFIHRDSGTVSIADLMNSKVDLSERGAYRLELKTADNFDWFYDFSTNSIKSSTSDSTFNFEPSLNTILDLNLSDLKFISSSSSSFSSSSSSESSSSSSLFSSSSSSESSSSSSLFSSSSSSESSSSSSLFSSSSSSESSSSSSESSYSSANSSISQVEGVFNISGKFILPDGITLGCDSDYKCNYVNIDIIDKATNSWVTYGQVDNTTYEYNLSLSQTGEYLVRLSYNINGQWNSFYYDLGSDKIVSGDELLINEMRAKYIDGILQVNPIAITPNDTNVVIDIDFKTYFENQYVLEGNVIVPQGFVPKDSYNSTTGMYERATVRVEAIDKSNGMYIGSTNISLDGVDGKYPYRLNLGSSAGDFIIKIIKEDNTAGTYNWEEMYFNFGADHIIGGGDDKIVSGRGINWICSYELNNSMCVPDINQTGYITINNKNTVVDIDISQIGMNDYRVVGSITPPAGIDLSAENTYANINLLSAKDGRWIVGNPIDKATNSFVLNIGENLESEGYILQLSFDHYNPSKPEENYWESFYIDFGADNVVSSDDTIKDAKEVKWIEKSVSGQTWNAWLPDVKPIIINPADKNTTLSVNLATVSNDKYRVSGVITGVSGAKWANVNLINFKDDIHINEPMKCSDGNCTFKVDLKPSEYILEFFYHVGDYPNEKYYHYFLKDTDTSLANGATVIDAQDVSWKEYNNNGQTYWAPNLDEITKFTVTDSNITINPITVTQESRYGLNFTVSGLSNYSGKNINANLYVPAKPIGAWKQSTISGDTLDFNFTDLKASDSYILQFWVDGLGEFYYDGDNTDNSKNGASLNNKLDREVYWKGYQNGQVCEYWRENISNCDWSSEVIWKPDVTPINLSTNQSLTASMPSMSKVNANFQLGADSANSKVWVSLFKYGGNSYAWGEFIADNNGDVNVSLAVADDTEYRLDFWAESLGSGFVYDKGSNGTIGGGDDKLISNQNSWEVSGTWGPKASTLFDVSGNTDLGTMALPSATKVTFNITNLVTDNSKVAEDLYISLEGLNSEGWYGKSNSKWRDGIVEYNDTIILKVPNGDYKVYVHPQFHKGGVANNGNGTADEALTTFNSFGWDWSKADKITVSGDSTITIDLPAPPQLYTINGTLDLSEVTNKSGWVSIWDNTNYLWFGTDVNSSGEFRLKAEAGNYELYYGGWYENVIVNGELNITTTDVKFNNFSTETTANISNNATNITLSRPSIRVDINGTISGAGDSATAMLFEYKDSNNWKVSKNFDLNSSGEFSFANMPILPAGYSYAVAVGIKDRNTTTGETTFTKHNLTIDSDNSSAVSKVDVNITNHITENSSITVSPNLVQYTK